MKKPKENFVGREAAVLRALTNIALANGVAKDTRSPSRPDWSLTGTVTISGETPANLIDEKGWYYSKENFHLREGNGPRGRALSRVVLSFEPSDIQQAKEGAAKRKQVLEDDARAKLAWTEYLRQPIPHLAEQITNKINVNDSVPVIRALATLDKETLEKVLAVLVKEEDDFVARIEAESSKA